MAVVDRVVHCNEAQIADAVSAMALTENQLVEGAAALALAGYEIIKQECVGQMNVVLLCGANYDPDTILPLIQ